MRTWLFHATLLSLSLSVSGQSRNKPGPTPQKHVVKVAEVSSSAPESFLPLSDDLVAIASNVLVGPMLCDGGEHVKVMALAHEGYFELQHKKMRYRMHPVESQTGAIRLEDRTRGMMWLQLSDKSMLMSQQRGMRLADDCAGEVQSAFARRLKQNPLPGLLDGAGSLQTGLPLQEQVHLLTPVAAGESVKH